MHIHKNQIIGVFLATALGILQSNAQQPAQQGGARTQPAQPEGGAQNKVLEQLRALREQGEAIQAQIGEISQKAEQENPELRTQHEELMELYQAKLEEHGYPDEDEMRALQEMQTRLQSAQEMDNAERQKLTQEFQGKVAQLQQAQEKARQDPEVQAAMDALEEARVKAMSAIDERTEDLVKQQEEINRKIEKLQQKMQQQFQMQQ